MAFGRLSGAQPTFSTLGRAKGSRKGNRRAKAGNRISRLDAFPEEGGHKLVSSSEGSKDGEEEEEEETRVVKKRRASSQNAKKERAKAAEKRKTEPRTRPRSPRRSGGIPSDFSHHSSDEEPDSDDPDRENGRVRRWKEKMNLEKARASGETAEGGVTNPDLAEIRRKRAEAAEKRRVEATTIVLDGEETEEEREYQARKQQEKAAQAEKGNGKGKQKEVVQGTSFARNGKSKGKGKEKEGVRLTKEQELAALEKELADMPPSIRLKHLNAAAKKLGIDTGDSRRASTSRTSPEQGSQPRRRPSEQLFNRSSSASHSSESEDDIVDPSRHGTDRSRAARRRRITGNQRASNGGGFSIQTGASGSGSASAFTIGGGGRGAPLDSFKKKTLKNTAQRKARRTSSPVLSVDSRSDEQSDSRPAAPTLPAFVDPRKDLARRKARELSDPPTDAFSSSGGSQEEDSEGAGGGGGGAKKKKVGGHRKKGQDALLDEWNKMERDMNRKKRAYREERRPGYSNPRKN